MHESQDNLDDDQVDLGGLNQLVERESKIKDLNPIMYSRILDSMANN